jgi:hypothetical protein
MITKEQILKFKPIFEDFPFNTQNDIDNGDIAPNTQIFFLKIFLFLN